MDKNSYWLEKIYYWPARRRIVRFEGRYTYNEALRRLQESIIQGYFPLSLSSIARVAPDQLVGFTSKNKIILIRSGHFFRANTKLIFKGKLIEDSDGRGIVEGVFSASITTKFTVWILVAMAIIIAINKPFAFIVSIPIFIVCKILLTLIFETIGKSDIAWISDRMIEILG